MKRSNIYIILSITTLFLLSCSNTQEDAKESIIGEWPVKEITSLYGTFSEDAYFNSSSEIETGDLGTFNFTPDSVSFNYTRNDTMYIGTSSWSLAHDRVNSGFVKVDQFRLTIDDYFLFDVGFEDGTSNSEKNAEKAQFDQLPTESTDLLISLLLEK